MRPPVASVAIVALLVVAGCPRPPTRIYEDPATGYTVSAHLHFISGQGLDLVSGERGSLNPAVIEYILGAPSAPFARYYDIVLALRSPPPRVVADLRALAGASGGSGPRDARGSAYGRALARRLAGPINAALGAERRRSILQMMVEGVASVAWGERADLDRGRLQDDYEGNPVYRRLQVFIARFESVKLVVVGCSGSANTYAWDLARVPGAFDAAAPLDYATVAKTIRPLHPPEDR